MIITEKSAPHTRQFSTFHLGGLYLGVEVLKVQELIRGQQMTRVPLAHAAVRGLINLRGQIVTAVDLRTKFGMASRPDPESMMNVVVRTEEGAVSLLVDEIGDVIEAADEQFEHLPMTMRSQHGDLVTGVYKLPSRLMLVLNAERAAAVDDTAVVDRLSA